MAGTDRTREAVSGGPAVVLVEPQLGENIGFVARAMRNFGLGDLRLVRPRDGWPNAKASAAASGADAVLDQARLFGTTAAAIADLHRLYAATARARDMRKPSLSAEEAGREMRALGDGAQAGILFGPERAGLHNDDVALADSILTVPLNPAFASLSLPQAVLLVGYEWFRGGAPPAEPEQVGAAPATKAQLMNLFEHLETELDAAGFLRHAERRPSMVRNLRNMLARAGLTEKEVSALRGVIRALAGK